MANPFPASLPSVSVFNLGLTHTGHWLGNLKFSYKKKKKKFSYKNLLLSCLRFHSYRDFPTGPGIKTSPSNARVMGLISG